MCPTRSPKGLVYRLKAAGQRVCAFGPPDGPMYDLIQSCGLDGWVEGPPVYAQQLQQVVATMQARKRQAMMDAMLGQQGE